MRCGAGCCMLWNWRGRMWRAGVRELTAEQLEARPFGLPSVGFQMRHIARSLDRLLTYAEGRQLNDAQLDGAEEQRWRIRVGGRELIRGVCEARDGVGDAEGEGDFADEIHEVGARVSVRKMLPTQCGWAAGALRGPYAAACRVRW